MLFKFFLRFFIHPGSGSYAEDYQLYNVTKYSSQGYSHLFVDQTNPDTSFAVDVSPEDNITDTFSATGDYIVYASSSGTILEPTKSISVDSSIPQGYFPSSSANYPSEQFFRGWASANYYVNGNLDLSLPQKLSQQSELGDFLKMGTMSGVLKPEGEQLTVKSALDRGELKINDRIIPM